MNAKGITKVKKNIYFLILCTRSRHFIIICKRLIKELRYINFQLYLLPFIYVANIVAILCFIIIFILSLITLIDNLLKYKYEYKGY